MRILSLILAITVCACANDNGPDSSTPSVIAIGVLPDQSVSSLTKRYAPLMDYLETATGLDIRLSIPSDYEEFLDEFDAGRLHIANFGGMTFVQAEHRSRAEPLVMRDVDLQFKSCYLVIATDNRRSISEFDGAAFSFGPELSTSGHLMPRHYMTMNGVVPESFFASIRYSSGHDQTAAWVVDGTVDIGVANCDIVRSLFEDGRSNTAKLRILRTTPPYANYVWATQHSLDASVKNLLRDAFLALDPSDPVHQRLLRLQGANGYLPGGRSDFDAIRAAAHAAGKLDTKEST